MVGRTPWSATGVKIRPFGQSQAARRDVAQTLVSAAPRLISALFVHEQEARLECLAGRLKPAPRRVGDQFRPCNGLILTPMPWSARVPLDPLYAKSTDSPLPNRPTWASAADQGVRPTQRRRSFSASASSGS